MRSKSNKSQNASSVLIQTMKLHIFSKLVQKGFEQTGAAGSMWTFHRENMEGGYDVIDFDFDKYYRPAFRCYINRIPPEGGCDIIGTPIKAENSTAICMNPRILIRPKKQRASDYLPFVLYAFMTPFCIHRDFFKIKNSKNDVGNENSARKVCEELVSYLDQAEKWWTT